MKKVSIVIPTINQVKMLFDDCLDSFVKFEGNKHEVIVVDDGSQPMIQNQIENECKRRGFKFEKNIKNSGFSATVNKGIRAATGDIIVLVNNDVVFTQPVCSEIVKTFNVHPSVGIVGALLFYPHGTVQHGGIVPVGVNGFTHRGWHKPVDASPEIQSSSYLIAVTGALFAIKRECVESIGMFNEKYFLSCDDTEFCLRAWMKNWRVFYNPAIQAIHAEGVTRGRTDIEKASKHRTWYLKELETWGKFQQDCRHIDIGGCLTKVNECNAELAGIDVHSGVSALAQSFGGIKTKAVSPQKKDRPEKILVKRTGALGDVIMATGIVRRIKQENPSAIVAVSTLCGDVFNNNPHVSEILRIESVIADKIIDLDMAYEKEPKMPVWEAYSKEAFGDINYDVSPEMFSTELDKINLGRKIPRLGQRERAAVLHMAVSWINRTWPKNLWQETVNILVRRGFKVVTVGKGGDFRADANSSVINGVEVFSLGEIRELMKRASVFVGVDSGMLHVAQTTDVPIVGLFTIANPNYRVVDRKSAKTIALVPQTECRFCLHEQTPPVTFVGCKFSTNHCLNEIKPSDVIDAVMSIAR